MVFHVPNFKGSVEKMYDSKSVTFELVFHLNSLDLRRYSFIWKEGNAEISKGELRKRLSIGAACTELSDYWPTSLFPDE
jgi:hypothetical protein